MNDLRTRVAEQLALEDADPVWLELLDQACAALDGVVALEQLIASDGMLATGSQGQTRVHPAVVELRQQRAAYSRLLLMLGIDERETTSQRQSRNARKRWDR